MLEFWAKKMGEYPGIKFESELIPFDQALEKMQIHLSQGAPTYDIMATDAFLPTFAERGWLMPLDPLIDKFRQAVEWDDIDPTLVRDVCSYKGKVYGVPEPVDLDVLLLPEGPPRRRRPPASRRRWTSGSPPPRP